MRIQVAYGRVDPATCVKCPRCKGYGEAETAFKSGTFQACPYCHGSGTHPHPDAYTYRTDEPVGVGDVVLVPGNWAVPNAQEATVVAVGSQYDGPTDSALRIVERQKQETP